MTGFILFRNAVLRVIRHLDEALAVSGLIWIGILILQILAFNSIDMEGVAAGDPSAVSTPAALMMLLSNVVMMVGSCWIAVEWHRFALEGKRPTSAFPNWAGARVWSYLLLSFLIGILVGLIVGVLAGLILSVFGVSMLAQLGGLFVTVVAGLPAIYVFLRISPVLPSAALGAKMTFSDAWRMTGPYSATIFQAGILSILALLAVQFLSPLFGQGILGLLYELAAGWLVLMINVSLLSSIYELTTRGQLHD